MYYTYMIRCLDNTIYTGITTDIKRRLEEHRSKNNKCAKYTLNHTIMKLEAFWESENRIQACKLEFHIKKLNKMQKEELILKNNLQELLGEKLDIENYKRIN